jgi:hypothetical protein
MLKEIQEVFTNRMLSPEFVLSELSVAQPTPDYLFRPGGFLA